MENEKNNNKNFKTNKLYKFSIVIQKLGTGEKEHPATENEVLVICRKKEDEGIMEKWAFGTHNMDCYDEEEEQEGKGIKGEKKVDHIHIMGKLPNGATPLTIANWFDIPFNLVKPITAHYFDDGVLYLTHSTPNSRHKYQYSPDIVKSNFDYKDLLKRKERTYKREKNKDKLYQRQMEIANDICSGKIKKYNQSQYITVEEEIIFSAAIDKAYKRYTRDYLNTHQTRNMQCIYITGNSGDAKTLLSKMICDSLNLHYKCLNGGSSDPFQEADGSDVYIINDFDFKTFGWKEFLNLTDNNTATAANSRYFDKVVDCKFLIFTCTKEPYEVIEKMEGAEDEQKVQAYRRLELFYKMDKENIKEYKFNVDNRKYELVKEHYNLMRQIGLELHKRAQEEAIKIDLNKVMEQAASNFKVLNLHKEEKEKEENKITNLLDLLNENDYSENKELFF